MERIRRFFFGDDVFISYSRRDGVRYATGLAGELTRRKLACRIDFWDTVPGTEIPDALRRAIRRSGLLAVVGSPGACTSRQVAAEIKEFLPTRRNLVPIAVAGPIDGADWFGMVEGLTVEEEPGPGALETGTPAESVVKRIEDSCDFARRNTRLRRTFGATLAGTVLVVIAAAVWSAVNVSRAASADARAHDADARASVAEGRVERANAAADLQERLASARQTVLEVGAARAEAGYTTASTFPRIIQAARQLLSLDQPVEAGAALATHFTDVPRLQARIQVARLEEIVTSPDGQWVAASAGAVAGQPQPNRIADNTTVIVWRTPTLREAARFRVDAHVTALAFTFDGGGLAVGFGNRAAIFELPSAKESVSAPFPGPLSRLSVSRDRRYIVGASAENIYVQTLPEGQLSTIPAEGEVDDLVFTADGSRLAAVVFEPGRGHVLLLVNLATGKPESGAFQDEAFNNDESGIFLALSRDGRLVGASCRQDSERNDCPTRIWALPDVVPYGQLPTRDTSMATFSPDGTSVATSEDGQTRIWNPFTGLLLGVVPGSGDVVFSADARTVAVAGRRGITSASSLDGTVAGMLERQGTDSRSAVSPNWTLLGLSAEGRHALVANRASGEIEAWLMEGIDRAPGFQHDGEVTEAVIPTSSNLLVVSSVFSDFERLAFATLWDVESGQRLLHVRVSDLPASRPDRHLTLLPFTSEGRDSTSARPAGGVRGVTAVPRVSAVTYLPSRRFLGLRRERTRDGTLFSLWDLTRGMILGQMQVVGSSGGERFTEDDASAFAMADGTVTLRDMNGRIRQVARAGGQLASALCAPEAGCLAAFQTDRGVDVWSLDRDEILVDIAGRAVLVALSADGRYVAALRDGFIEVWEIAGRRRLARRAAPAESVYLGFTPDGRHLVAGFGRRVQLWTWHPDDMLRSACERLAVNAESQAWTALLTRADVDRACQ